MSRSKRDAQCRVAPAVCVTLTLALGAVLIPSTSALPQNRPPLQEPIALEGTMKQFYRAANVVVVTTMDGMEHVYQFTKDLIVHGGKKPGVNGLDELREGTNVVIHQKLGGSQALAEEIDVLGEEGLKSTEGVVTHIDRRKKEITIEYANGRTETFQMTSRAAGESDATIDESSEEASSRVVIYYSDEAGRKVAHYFKKES
jgi:hypothetical protein